MSDPTGGAVPTMSRFELAAPRRFILPAVLLLVSERPAYGYGLLPQLEELQLGHVDRPAVYRALAQLERDGLVCAALSPPADGGGHGVQARRVYRITVLGERVLADWMEVVKKEHEGLGEVLHRYAATSTCDAVLAGVAGGWSAALGAGWSPVSATPPPHRRPHLVAPAPEPATGTSPGPCPESRYRLVPGRCALLIEVRSTAGPLSFGTLGVAGWVRAAVAGGALAGAPTAHLEVDVSELQSGSRLYDAELLRRIDARRYPTAQVDLRRCTATALPARYALEGDLTFHGVTRPVQGAVTAAVAPGQRLVISGVQAFDIRDFALSSPTVLMLRIYPDVQVRLQIEAERDNR